MHELVMSLKEDFLEREMLGCLVIWLVDQMMK